MDTTNTSTISRGLERRRRAYLDSRTPELETYAKTRLEAAGLRQTDTGVQPVPLSAETKAPPRDIPYSSAAIDAKKRKQCLAKLVLRHQAAVRQSPEALETVDTPSLWQDIHNLLDDAGQDDQLTVNLRALERVFVDKTVRSASRLHVWAIVAGIVVISSGVAAGTLGSLLRADASVLSVQPVARSIIEVEVPLRMQQSVNGALPSAGSDSRQDDTLQPIRLAISRLNVHSSLENVPVRPDGIVARPKLSSQAGWYSGSQLPGQPGASLFVGYNHQEEAIFSRIGNLIAGDIITVTNAKGQVLQYKVTKKTAYQKHQLPLKDLTKTKGVSTLHLVTTTDYWQADANQKRLVISAELIG